MPVREALTMQRKWPANGTSVRDSTVVSKYGHFEEEMLPPA
jgi:hypothetical protein